MDSAPLLILTGYASKFNDSQLQLGSVSSVLLDTKSVRVCGLLFMRCTPIGDSQVWTCVKGRGEYEANYRPEKLEFQN